MGETHAFHLISHWRVPGRIDTVFDALSDHAGIARWWPELYAEVREVAPGGPDGAGRVLDVVSRGRLPYRLRWRLRVRDVRRPERIEIEASGDLIGVGVWTLRQDGGEADLTYDWRVSVGKPWLRRLRPLLRPLLAANHDWVMARGLDGLRRELAGRAGATG
jgi:uncharacterized protein YndB with AHSA1/START domain